MSNFIENIAKEIYAKQKDNFQQTIVIFPNRRACLFFIKSLSKIIDNPVWMPQVFSFEDFVNHFEKTETIEKIETIFLLYDIYKKYQNNAELLEKFYFWGEVILSDFEEIDHYQVNSEKIFSFIKSQKELDEQFYFLDEYQRNIIKSFWATFLPETTDTQNAFLETWKLLHPIYLDFRESLKLQKKATQGMKYGHFFENIINKKIQIDEKIFFCGMNGLTTVEEKVIKQCVLDFNAEIFWNIDNYYMKNDLQEAGHYFRKYKKDTILSKFFSKDFPKDFENKKEIITTGVSLEVGQVKSMALDISKLAASSNFDPSKTIIILPKEYMLMPVLHSLPENINVLNVTMGYPLKETSVFSLIENILQLQITSKIDEIEGITFYSRSLFAFLKHPLIIPLLELENKNFIEEIKKKKFIYIPKDEISSSQSLSDLFFHQPKNPLDYLIQAVEYIFSYWEQKETNTLETECLNSVSHHLQIVKEQIIKYHYNDFSFDFLLKFFRKSFNTFKVPFSGEPLEGVQVMGIFESRNLEFDNVFILNMNENSFPPSLNQSSFIPYNIRKAFELPTYEHFQSIYATAFYDIIKNAKNLFIYYNTFSSFNQNGELSHLVRQIETESSHKIIKRNLQNTIFIKKSDTIIIEKKAEVMKLLKKYEIGNLNSYSRLTPSSLDVYVNCSLQFYFKYLLELYDTDDLQEDINAVIFGNILHQTMEIIYSHFIKTQKRNRIEKSDFFNLGTTVTGAMNKAFSEYFNQKNNQKYKLKDRMAVVAEVMDKLVQRILKIDENYAPFEIISIEKGTYQYDMPLKSKKNVTIGLKGIIDRVDKKDDIIRILDYKTGKDVDNFDSIESLFKGDKDKNKAAFQLLYYSFLYSKKNNSANVKIEPALFNIKSIFDANFNSRLILGKDKIKIDDYQPFAEEFEERIENLINEIWDDSIPFTQTEDYNICSYCSYKDICKR